MFMVRSSPMKKLHFYDTVVLPYRSNTVILIYPRLCVEIQIFMGSTSEMSADRRKEEHVQEGEGIFF
jgi:hypothetical protein